MDMFSLIYTYCTVLGDVSRNGHRAVWFSENDGTTPVVQTNIYDEEERDYLSFSCATKKDFDMIIETVL